MFNFFLLKTYRTTHVQLVTASVSSTKCSSSECGLLKAYEVIEMFCTILLYISIIRDSSAAGAVCPT